MKAIVGRLRRIETRMGVVETEENRRARQQLEILQQRIARLARDEGREYQSLSERDLEDLVGFSIEDVLSRGRERVQRL